MITDFLKESKSISFGGCMSQIFFAHFIAAGEMVLLVAMAIMESSANHSTTLAL
jgi:olfactory receptor